MRALTSWKHRQCVSCFIFKFNYNYNTIDDMNKRFKISILSFIIFAFAFIGNAKEAVIYRTFIYTSEDLAEEIQRANDSQDDSRRFDVDLLNATIGAAKGIGAGYISSFIDLGVNALGNLITKNARQKKEWEEMVKKRKYLVYQNHIHPRC